MSRGTQRSDEEVLVPFPSGSRDTTRPAERFRSTWLASSLRSLRARRHFDAYLQYLPREHHDAVINNVVGVWLSIDVAVAHYDACDALGLTPNEIVQIGREATDQVHGTLLATFVRLAKGAGVTPWTVLPRLQDLWARVWVGGGVSIVKLGPKEARVEIAGWPCLKSTYCRTAMRGVLPAITDLFCRKSYAKEIPAFATPSTAAYVLSWA